MIINNFKWLYFKWNHKNTLNPHHILINTIKQITHAGLGHVASWIWWTFAQQLYMKKKNKQKVGTSCKIMKLTFMLDFEVNDEFSVNSIVLISSNLPSKPRKFVVQVKIQQKVSFMSFHDISVFLYVESFKKPRKRNRFWNASSQSVFFLRKKINNIKNVLCVFLPKFKKKNH